jgi:hypothetical protein
MPSILPRGTRNSFRSTSASDDGRIRRFRRASRRCGGWCSASATARVWGPFPSSAAPRLRQSFPAREWTRRRRTSPAPRAIADRRNAALHRQERAGRAQGRRWMPRTSPGKVERRPTGQRSTYQPSSSLETVWRRRESNPRPQPHRMSVYKHRRHLDLTRRPECHRPTDEPALLKCRASGEWLSFGAKPVR